MVLVFVAYLGILITSPIAAKPVPADCTTSVSHLPSSARYDIPGVGPGTLLTGDAQTAVAVVGSYGHAPFTSTVYVVSKGRHEVLQQLSFTDDVLAAAIQSGTVYLFNDKILHLLDSGTGTLILLPIESDNYRGLYASNGGRYMQTDLVITTIRPGSVFVLNRHLRLNAMAFGCVLS
jgi:hypothetical protein